MTVVAVLTAVEAKALEEKFLLGIGDAQSAYEQIVEQQAWTPLGFDSLGDWWDARVRPVMTALSMKPTREIAAAVIEQVRTEEAALPATWRRTQAQLAEMVGGGRDMQVIRQRSTSGVNTHGDDLVDPAADEVGITDAIDDVPLPFDQPEPEGTHETSTPAMPELTTEQKRANAEFVAAVRESAERQQQEVLEMLAKQEASNAFGRACDGLLAAVSYAAAFRPPAEIPAERIDQFITRTERLLEAARTWKEQTA
ncbi:hypothetical protein [Roseateles sp.]|uniref:hypothetical protein n=1 Tax=Roseateles sp. TaxID=1971397 RepID=UPI002F42458C